jgi:hypothetical protein
VALFVCLYSRLYHFALVGVISWFIKSLIAAKPGGNELLQEREVSLTNDAHQNHHRRHLLKHKRIGEKLHLRAIFLKNSER